MIDIKNAPITKSNESAAELNNTISRLSNVREQRALEALRKAESRGVSRKELDAACGTSNSPELIRRLRGKGFAIHCEMRETKNRFYEPVRAGFYTLISEVQ